MRFAEGFGRRWIAASIGLPVLLSVLAGGSALTARAQDGGAITLRADVQEANANTGIVTARGNVRIDYPTRQIYATSAQAQYFSRERRILLTGNVFVQQEENTLRAERVTYLIDEGRFVATPQPEQQVESVYILPTSPAPTPAAESAPPRELPDLPDPVPAELPNTAIPTDE
ncbi:MAG: hypothetical protein F6J97_04475 [Leptolyngbya sp. SIO4C1]|nr:hypothetical protein [Leptolyngbya sp. SIO4C1]